MPTTLYPQMRITLTAIVTLGVMLITGPSDAISKCTLNGQLIYTDQPCPADAIDQPYTQPVSPPDDPAAAKQRYLADKKKLDQINRQKAREEKKLQHDAQACEHQKKLARNQALQCKNLDLKLQAARQHLADIKRQNNTRQIKKSRMQVQQAENNYAKACTSE